MTLIFEEKAPPHTHQKKKYENAVYLQSVLVPVHHMKNQIDHSWSRHDFFYKQRFFFQLILSVA